MTFSASTTCASKPSVSRRFGSAALVHAISPLIWLPQAFLIAYSVWLLQQNSSIGAVVWPAVAFVFLGVLKALLEAWSQARLHDEARGFISQWRHYVLNTLAAQSPLDRHRPPAGAAASVLAEQAEAILPWLTRYQAAMLRVKVVPIVLFFAVLWFSWAAALVLLLAAPLIPLFMAIVGWRAQKASEEQWLQLAGMNGFLLDRLRGLATLRALGALHLTAKRVRTSAENLRLRTMRVLRIAFMSSGVLELFSALGVAMVAVYVGFHLLGQLNFGAWGQRLSLSEGLFILLLAPNFFEPLRELATAWHDRADGEAAMTALEALTERGLLLPEAQGKQELINDSSPAQPISMAATTPAFAVSIQDLTFGFDDQAPLFQHLNLSIAAGEKVAIVGKSGAGKTVLLALIAGLLTPQSGQIWFGNTLCTPETIRNLRQHIGWMGQRAHVFAASIADNVSLKRPATQDQTITNAIASAHLSHVAQAHPGVVLGEGGQGLSGGELARLALARVAFNQQAGLLLLDEPTAHLDSDTADIIREGVQGMAQGRSLIVATHDPLLIEQMDRVIRLENLIASSQKVSTQHTPQNEIRAGALAEVYDGSA